VERTTADADDGDGSAAHSTVDEALRATLVAAQSKLWSTERQLAAVSEVGRCRLARSDPR